jgi:hypothetical protein
MAPPIDVVAKLMFGTPLPAQEIVAPAITTSDPETVFSALDGRELIVLGRRWKTEVFSVCELGGCRYVQLSLQGEQQYMLTLRVASSADIKQLVPRLLSWLAHPSSSGEILDVE